MKRLAIYAAACLIVVGFFGVPLCRAADKPAAKQPASDKQLDDQLLRELGEEPADRKAGSPPMEPGPRLGDPAPQPAKKPVSPLDEDLLKQLEGDDAKRPAAAEEPAAAEKGAADGGPVDRLTREMRDVQQRLARQKSDADTQQLEQKIVEALEQLVKEASQQQSSSSSSSSKSQSQQKAERDKAAQPQPGQQAGGAAKDPNGPARDSSKRVGKPKVEKPNLAKLQDLMKDVWGELPPRLRQQMMQSSVEHFVPKYEFEIEEYFKTLAERQREKP
ncbi:MAG TPA: hypothetical protein VHV55_00430 [Pirellulales bacterium]|jgi:hypothetical protein|nr:hypothetical protein [Pirellulales bacterium]